MAKADLTAARVRELLDYNPDTGVFTWKISPAQRIKRGTVAGAAAEYVRIQIGGRKLRAHRLAWLYMTGAWPTQEVDHIDGDPLNNRWANLRNVSRVVNMQNQRQARSDNPTKLLGAHPHGRGYASTINVRGQTHYLGRFSTPEAAHAAYVAAKRRLHEGCTI